MDLVDLNYVCLIYVNVLHVEILVDLVDLNNTIEPACPFVNVEILVDLVDLNQMVGYGRVLKKWSRSLWISWI